MSTVRGQPGPPGPDEHVPREPDEPAPGLAGEPVPHGQDVPHGPDVPPGPGGGASSWGGPAPVPPAAPRRRRKRLVLSAAVLAATLAVALGSGWALGGHDSTPTAARPLTTAAIIAKTNPSVADINSTLGYQHATASGTGIVLTSSGEVLTNNHVIEGATAISVTDVGNGRTYHATVAGYDEIDDIAVLQLQGVSGLATASLGDSSKVTAGTKVVAIGNAGGKGGTPSATTGSVTSLDAAITATDESASTTERLTGLIRTSAALEAGDSGGPLVNTAGQVIGIDTAASSGFQIEPGGGSESFAIPVNQALAIAKQIEAGKSSPTVHIGATGFLGVALLTPGSEGPGGSAVTGPTVTAVQPGSPAQAAGLVPGDVIETVDGQSVDSQAAVAAIVTHHHPGDRVSVTWLDQSGRRHAATVVLATGPAG